MTKSRPIRYQEKSQSGAFGEGLLKEGPLPACLEHLCAAGCRVDILRSADDKHMLGMSDGKEEEPGFLGKFLEAPHQS